MQQEIFSALSDPTRREILGMLKESDKNLSEISVHFNMSRPAVSKHVRILERADLIKIVPDGRRRIHILNPEGLRPAYDWLKIFDVFWDEKLDALKSLIERENP